MSADDDLRTLSQIDRHHRDLVDVSDRWIERSGLTVFSSRPGAGVPFAAVALKMQGGPCPADPSVTARIKYWVVNLPKPRPVLARALADTAVQMADELQRLGHSGVWGFVPRNVPEAMTGFLDALEQLGLLTRHAVEDVRPSEGEPDYTDGAGWYYVTTNLSGILDDTRPHL